MEVWSEVSREQPPAWRREVARMQDRPVGKFVMDLFQNYRYAIIKSEANSKK